jgi:serine/threonine protein kinase
MAPEVLNNVKYGTEADLHSFGVTMWECLTRDWPFEGMNGIQVAMKVLTEGKTGVEPNWCRVGSPKLCILVEACLMMDPRRRPTFAEILKSLEDDDIYNVCEYRINGLVNYHVLLTLLPIAKLEHQERQHPKHHSQH